jgi:diacylglycerol O-acyltransferase / wax synthase
MRSGRRRSARWPSWTAACPARGGRVRVEAVREIIAARLRLVPRFWHLLYVPRPGLGLPLWVDAPAFDLADHVKVVPVPAPR